MPVVDKNQLKIWFKNLAKPVQEQFWNWMDSFYHKSEPIPKSAVENLTTDLAKKADLVGGVVPASQLPFSVNTSEVIAVGEISATENTVTLSVHSSGTNAVRINGVVLTRAFPNTFNFTPVTDGSKFLILYAINESGIFRLAEGVEDLEAVEPELPAGALFVRRILINSAGADVELPTLTGFKEKKEDNWKVFLFSQTDAPVFLPFSDGRTSFILLSQNSLAGNLILGGFARGQADANWWSGKELTILNNTGTNVSLQNIAGFDELTQATFRANYVLKNNETVKVKVLQDGDLLEVMAVSIDISGKLDKGGYTGTAQDLKNDIDNIQSGDIDTSDLVPYNGATQNVNIGEYYFESSKGFKKTGGNANQALTADGSVFDLTAKADLVGGKVPKAQSQPSTMVMNSSTYVITFTDATGAVQTIDLPLESLFKDANYNSSTKSLIVTLQDGTTRNIPLTDLVDLPEIVLATTNPAVTPTTGQKVYFNTSLGKVWFNVSGAWVFGGNLISDTEKANITTAYNHSQETGNPHDTELEQLTDVSGDTTTIIDTDVILKKEVGGLWKKITFANFKNWFTNELAKKINIGVDTVFNFKNISAMTLTQFKALTPNLETIYFTEEQNATGWQQIKYNGLGISIPATTETLVSLTNENYIELDSDSTFNLIDVANTKINGIFEKDFVIIKFNAGVVTPATANQWFKVILKVNNVQTAVSPVFYLTETSGTVEQIAHNFSLNVPAEMVTNGATLHLKTSVAMTFNNPAISVVRVHKSTNANL